MMAPFCFWNRTVKLSQACQIVRVNDRVLLLGMGSGKGSTVPLSPAQRCRSFLLVIAPLFPRPASVPATEP
jgi:hypothetical protein